MILHLKFNFVAIIINNFMGLTVSKPSNNCLPKSTLLDVNNSLESWNIKYIKKKDWFNDRMWLVDLPNGWKVEKQENHSNIEIYYLISNDNKIMAEIQGSAYPEKYYNIFIQHEKLQQ